MGGRVPKSSGEVPMCFTRGPTSELVEDRIHRILDEPKLWSELSLLADGVSGWSTTIEAIGDVFDRCAAILWPKM